MVQKNDIAVALQDPAVKSLLAGVGASVSWQPGERYILVTTAEPKIVSFAMGDTRYDAGDVSSQAAFAPYEKDGDAYLPLYALARALYLEPKNDRGVMVLQPQIATAEVQSQREVAQLVLHGALPLSARKITSEGGRVVYDFAGFGSTLERSRRIRANGLAEIDVDMGGTTRNPDTRITLVLAPGAGIGDGAAGNYHDFSVSLSSHGNVARSSAPPPPPRILPATPSPTPAPGEIEQPAAPSPLPAMAAVTAVSGLQTADGFDVQIAVSGNASFDWHRLLDGRWYIDIHGATLQAPSGDTAETAPSVSSLRVHQLSGDTVRVALSLTGQKPVDVSASDKGISISVKDQDAQDIARTGSGQVGNAATSSISPQPGPSAPAGWKYGVSNDVPVAANPRLIVIDPGHGGSDPGAVRADVVEKIVNLDISKRLRNILIARGWQVSMTRETDRDVYSANDSAREELQARCDVANSAGARLFVSVHANTAGSSSVSGTTFYVSKPMDAALARAVQRRVTAQSGTADDGVQKAKFYVTLHTNMPALLIETAFMTNPSDYQLLVSGDWRQHMAQAIADGIGDYAGSPGAPGQSTQRKRK
ncbi:MAG: N-acetylmuramoyl-L-alanine amidase [Candidatus Baltobacteraceae bacterium]